MSITRQQSQNVTERGSSSRLLPSLQAHRRRRAVLVDTAPTRGLCCSWGTLIFHSGEEASLPDLCSASKQPSAQRKTWVPSSKAAQTNILGRKPGAKGQEVSAHQTCRIMRTMQTVPRWGRKGCGHKNYMRTWQLEAFQIQSTLYR